MRVFPSRLAAGLAPILALAAAAAIQAGPLRAGAARAAITPAADEFPYANHGEASFVGVHDPIYARALVLDDGTSRVAVVIVEVTKIPVPEILRSGIAHALSVPESHVLLAASHTHNVPLFSFHSETPSAAERREIERLTAGTLAAVREAGAHLQPARIAFGRGQAYVNVNSGEASGAKGYDPVGVSDKSLDVLRVDTPQGAPLALLVTYASHAEVMFRSITRDGGYEVSGDLPGAVSAYLEALPAAAPVVLYAPTAEADQQPLFKSLQNAGPLPAADAGAAGWAVLDVQARRLAGSVMDVVAALAPGTGEVQLRAADGVATCPGQKVLRDPNGKPTGIIKAAPVAIPLSAIRINDIALAGVGGDVGTEIGLAIKAASPLPHTAVIEMTAGSVGYVLADSAYEHPGHAVLGSPLQAHCALPAVTAGLVGLIGKPQ